MCLSCVLGRKVMSSRVYRSSDALTLDENNEEARKVCPASMGEWAAEINRALYPGQERRRGLTAHMVNHMGTSPRPAQRAILFNRGVKRE